MAFLYRAIKSLHSSFFIVSHLKKVKGMTTTLMKRNGEPNVFSPLPTLHSFFNDPFLRDWFSWDNEATVGDSTLPPVNIGETEDTLN
jgi:hypothetical protein